MLRLWTRRPVRTTTLLLPVVALLHVVLAPYSKVEESFSTQAAHDILVHGVHPSALQHYDHVVFPGAVPRSFLGPLLLALITYPLSLIGQAVGLVRSSADVQTIMRSALVLLTAKALSSFGNALFTPPKLTQREAWIHRACFDIITALQFHFLFWASRTTPNSIALPFVLHAFKHIAALPTSQPRFLHGISHLTFLAATLRLELAGFLIPASILFLAGVGAGSPDRLLRLSRLLRAGLLGGIAGAVSSVVVDTYFWRGPGALLKPRQWLWPELSGLLFNVVEGKSSEWGISPWHTYLTTSLPKLLSATLLLLLWTIITRLQPQADRKGKAKSVPPVNKRLPNMTPIRWLLALCAGHIGLLSLLGHKEWRFIVYTVPCFNAGSALGLRRLLMTRPRQLVALLILALTAAITALLTLISHVNYPGGHALHLLEQRLASAPPTSTPETVRIHIDVLPAMTGVTLFQARNLRRSSSSSAAAQVPSGGFGIPWLPPGVPSPLPSPRAPRRTVEYDKTENLDRDADNVAAVTHWSTYDYLLTDRAGCRIFDSSSRPPEADVAHSNRSSSAADESSTTSSLDIFEPLYEVQAYAGLQLQPPRAYLDSVLRFPHGALWQHALGKGDTAPESAGLSRWWRTVNAALPLVEIRTAPAVSVCGRKGTLQGCK
ncbi:hypothetical protein V8E36_001505 [Tilletia maclaganii]